MYELAVVRAEGGVEKEIGRVPIDNGDTLFIGGEGKTQRNEPFRVVDGTYHDLRVPIRGITGVSVTPDDSGIDTVSELVVQVREDERLGVGLAPGVHLESSVAWSHHVGTELPLFDGETPLDVIGTDAAIYGCVDRVSSIGLLLALTPMNDGVVRYLGDPAAFAEEHGDATMVRIPDYDSGRGGTGLQGNVSVTLDDGTSVRVERFDYTALARVIQRAIKHTKSNNGDIGSLTEQFRRLRGLAHETGNEIKV